MKAVFYFILSLTVSLIYGASLRFLELSTRGIIFMAILFILYGLISFFYGIKLGKENKK